MRARLALILVALACGPLVPGQPVAAASASGTWHRSAVIALHKNYGDTFRSRLTWTVVEARGSERRTLVSTSWRAGSGFRRHATDSCRRNDGWLPNGVYHPRLYADYGGRLIKGRAIYLGDRRCHDGTLRTALFIHTEQGAGNRQCPDRRGDQPCRWEYPRINDYRSLGCIKLSPGDLHELTDAWHAYDRSGGGATVVVRVG